MIKIAMISLCALILIVILKRTNKEFAFILTIAAAVILFGLIIDDFIEVIKRIYALSSELEGANSYIMLMVKILGITLITQFIIDLCRDSGENALASQTEITSKILILVMVMPLFEAVMNVISGLLK